MMANNQLVKHKPIAIDLRLPQPMQPHGAWQMRPAPDSYEPQPMVNVASVDLEKLAGLFDWFCRDGIVAMLAVLLVTVFVVGICSLLLLPVLLMLKAL